MGPDAFEGVKEAIGKQDKILSDWEDVIKSTDF
jgi:hypothetical protein